MGKMVTMTYLLWRDEIQANFLFIFSLILLFQVILFKPNIKTDIQNVFRTLLGKENVQSRRLFNVYNRKHVMIKADTFGDFPIYRLWSCIFGMFACLVHIIISTSCANYAITKKVDVRKLFVLHENSPQGEKLASKKKQLFICSITNVCAYILYICKYS